MNPEQLKFVNRYTNQILDQHSPFLKLPPEIRNMIYEFVIEHHLDDHDHANTGRASSRVHFIPPLFAATQQIRSEGLFLLYHWHVRVAWVPLDTTRLQLQEYTYEEACKLSLSPVEAPGLLEVAREWTAANFLLIRKLRSTTGFCVVYRHGRGVGEYQPYEICD